MKKLLKKHWPLILMGILLVVVSYYLIKGRHEILQGRILTDILSEEGIKLENISYTQTSPDEGVKWSLDAKEVKFSKDRQFISFSDFRLKLEPENRPSVELEGKRGDYDKNSGEINLHGDLQGYTNNGYKIITQHILYKQKEGFLRTEEPVKITGPFFSIAGRGLYFNLEKETLRIMSGVTTSIDSESFIL